MHLKVLSFLCMQVIIIYEFKSAFYNIYPCADLYKVTKVEE